MLSKTPKKKNLLNAKLSKPTKEKSQVKRKLSTAAKKLAVDAEKTLTKTPKNDEVKKKKNIKPTKETLTRRERRSLKVDAKKHSETARYLLSKWEILRRQDTEKDRKFELVDQMMKNCKNSLSELCFAHDTARIVESMIQNGTERQRFEIFELLRPKLIEMTETQFGRFVVIKLVTYCSKDHISQIIKMVSGQVAKLLTHKYSCEIVELLFNEHANAKQRCQMLQELYGNRDLLGLTDQVKGTLTDAIKMNQDKRQTILTNVNDMLVKMVSKNLTNMSLVQRLLLEYLTAEIGFLSPMMPGASSEVKATAPGEDFKLPERVSTLIDAFIEHSQFVPMLHTREGVRVALCLLWLSTPKIKKGIAKSLKTSVASIAMNEHGYIFIIGLLDFVDDATLLEKTVVKEMLQDLEILVAHPHARKVLLYALNPRDSHHFSQQLINSLISPGDLSPFTRKPLTVRALELRSMSMGILPDLLRLASAKLVQLFVGDRVEHFQPVLDRGRLILLVEIINQSAPKALEWSYCQSRYRRSVNVEQQTGVKIQELTATEMEAMQSVRKVVLRAFVKHCFSPEFVPSGKQLPKMTDKDQTQQKRRKKALALAEEQSIKRRKITVPAFTNMENAKKSVRLDGAESEPEEEEEANQMEVDEEQPQKAPEMELSKEDEILLEMPWLERPEATPIVSKLLENCKRFQDFDFLDSVIELVPASVLRSWTTCNRTCFILVKMMEIGYQPMVDHVKGNVVNAKLIKALKVSDLAGAKILLDKLS